MRGVIRNGYLYLTAYDDTGIYKINLKDGKGSDAGWGKLKSGAGWISLDYCQRV